MAVSQRLIRMKKEIALNILEIGALSLMSVYDLITRKKLVFLSVPDTAKYNKSLVKKT